MRASTGWLVIIAACAAMHCGAQDLEVTTPDDTGACVVTGQLEAGSDAAVRCALDHDEQVPLSASIETGSLDVQGWLLRSTGHDVLVGLRNTGPAPVDLVATRIVIGRMVRATRRAHPRGYPPEDRCIEKAIAERGDVAACEQWK